MSSGMECNNKKKPKNAISVSFPIFSNKYGEKRAIDEIFSSPSSFCTFDQNFLILRKLFPSARIPLVDEEYERMTGRKDMLINLEEAVRRFLVILLDLPVLP